MMKFKSYDSIKNTECETEIRSADANAIEDFSLWDTYVDHKIIREKDRDFNYRIFEWDKILRMSLNIGFDYSCYAAYTGTRLNGLLTLRNQDKLYLDFFATAPWNYFGVKGTMRRIGSGLVYFTINASRVSGFNGEFSLYALEEAERYCERIGMVHTGHFKFGLKEYRMEKDRAANFERDFHKYVVDE
ncbi:MAG: hypothetical protein NT022_10945 [Deltaproteobacteria bacterium]|nr:hypothetical protein [Deltaproteobacteria bacterium]